ncbi:hypothetical protein G6O69_24840 [Pseudenhygromyxa sp. WMMC2535]|uniref:hypothetical protein n=1 Tax=Pseudenhygromyxa sp. WMMC2535 TaxID=2712867 RepID=UPI0015959CA6|nr:hypothetical protein [Pseudenhygromyxa sp. WMMC2535]NVB41090.1 hypothetical protein [Pseudenhygromyxa sp. WMMC2535]
MLAPRCFVPMSLVVLCAACNQPDPVYVPAPEHLLSATSVPDMPENPDDPWARLLWTMNYDLREFDATWTWLEDEATPGLERDRSMGAAALLGSRSSIASNCSTPASTASPTRSPGIPTTGGCRPGGPTW